MDAMNPVFTTTATARGRRNGRTRSVDGLQVSLRVEDPSLPQDELAVLVKDVHEKVRPNSHATRNNLRVDFEVVGRWRTCPAGPVRSGHGTQRRTIRGARIHAARSIAAHRWVSAWSTTATRRSS